MNAKIVLGSATPSVETYFNAVNNKYGLVELKERYGGIALPEIEIIDTKKSSPFAKEKIIVTDSLQEEITQVT